MRRDPLRSAVKEVVFSYVTEQSVDDEFLHQDVLKNYRRDVLLCALWLLRKIKEEDRFGAIPAAVVLAFKVIAQHDGIKFDEITHMLRKKCVLPGLERYCKHEHLINMELELLKHADWMPCKTIEGVKVGEEKGRKRKKPG